LFVSSRRDFSCSLSIQSLPTRFFPVKLVFRSIFWYAQEHTPPVFLASVFHGSFNAGSHFVVAAWISARSIASRHSRVADLICAGNFFGVLILLVSRSIC
jgi:hypothetical protein